MKKMLIVCGSGGHAAGALLLYKDLKDHFDIQFLIERDDPLTAKRLEGVKVYKATSLRGKHAGWISTFFRALLSSFECVIVFFRSWPDIVLSNGPGFAVPTAYIAKIFGKKVIFFESWSRVTSKSIAGKFIYPLADLFIVQWPSMLKKYKKAIYLGRLK